MFSKLHSVASILSDPTESQRTQMSANSDPGEQEPDKHFFLIYFLLKDNSVTALQNFIGFCQTST